jgi:SAM-dependent methyltransferase
MNSTTEVWMRTEYGRIAAQYRQSDEDHVQGQDYERIADILTRLSSQFGRPVTVLDLGCGTGRYFHCLRNVERLVGVDICPEMLEQARCPVRQERAEIQKLDLICDSIYAVRFPEKSFDLIQCVGVFGNGCGATQQFLSHCHSWLRPGGALFFDALDGSVISSWQKARKRARQLWHDLIGRSLVRFTGNIPVWPPLYWLGKGEVEHLLARAGFREMRVEARDCHMPGGPGRKLECIAVRSATAPGEVTSPEAHSFTRSDADTAQPGS